MKKSSRVRPLRWMLLAALLLGGATADSNLRIVTTRYELTLEKLPAALDGFRIVQVSDVHGAVFGKDNVRLLSAVEQAAPDLIALTGDLADGKTRLADVDTLLAGLTALAPCYYVSGNHEWSDRVLRPLRALLDRHGVGYLRNEYVRVTRDGESFVLAGVEDPNGWADQPGPEQVAESLPADTARVLLAHRNYWPRRYPSLPVDLILCGHAHGGVIRLPLLGGLLDHSGRLLPEYEAGLYTAGGYEMLVSRGLGNSGGVPRLFNNPEVVVVTLRAP